MALVRDFTKARGRARRTLEMEVADTYPAALVDRMAELGLFGITIPESHGGLGLDHTTFAIIFEELSKAWMSLTGPIGTHHVLAALIAESGTEEQRRRWLPDMAAGRLRGGLALTEPSGGSDVKNLRTRAVRDGDHYVLSGSKMFITNGAYGGAFAVLARTDAAAEPAASWTKSCFVVERSTEGFGVGRKLDKLGYRGVDTCELVFDKARVPAASLVGGTRGQGIRAGNVGTRGGQDQRGRSRSGSCPGGLRRRRAL